MKLTLMGCEYAGKRTLGVEIAKWWAEQTGGEFNAAPAIHFHDHFNVPHIVHTQGHEDHRELSEKKILEMNPGLLEHFQRFQIEYHFSRAFVEDQDHWNIDWYYADAVFAPLYYGYGGPGEYADRWEMVPHYEKEVMHLMPDAVLVLVKASPEVIRRRIREGASPFPERHTGSLLQDKDIELVLDRFHQLFDDSLIRQRFAIDTSSATVDESLEEFVKKVESYIAPEDRRRIEDHKAQSGA